MGNVHSTQYISCGTCSQVYRARHNITKCNQNIAAMDVLIHHLSGMQTSYNACQFDIDMNYNYIYGHICIVQEHVRMCVHMHMHMCVLHIYICLHAIITSCECSSDPYGNENRNVRIRITLLTSCTWLPKMDATMADQLELPNDKRPFPASTKDSFKNRVVMFSLCTLRTFVAI